ncbi:MAG TPA: hypothetical protein VEC36_06435 [Patescibacteria group bacterium]|nr:hypothetical protein [Patescibacteria group bacterium]
MKNLFLPFVVVALFAFGSCGDDVVQPSVNRPSDTFEVYGGSVSVKNAAVLVQQYAKSQSDTREPIKIVRDTTEKVLSFGDYFGEDSTNRFSEKAHRVSFQKKGDTLFLTDILSLYQGSWTDHRLVLALVIDSVNQSIPYLRYGNRESAGYSYGYGDEAKSQINEHSLILRNVLYRRTDSTIIIRMVPSPTQLSELYYFTSSNYERGNGKGTTYYINNSSTSVLSLLPFRSDFFIDIELKYRYK